MKLNMIKRTKFVITSLQVYEWFLGENLDRKCSLYCFSIKIKILL